MNLVVALCIAALELAAPLTCRSVAAPRDAAPAPSPAALTPLPAPPAPDDDIADLIIPLLERSLDSTKRRSSTSKHHSRKVVQVLPYEGSYEHAKQGWNKLKTNKKQLVEITPLRRKGGDSKPLAYILSAANTVVDNDKAHSSSESSSFEDNTEYESNTATAETVAERTGMNDEIGKDISYGRKIVSDERVDESDLSHDGVEVPITEEDATQMNAVNEEIIEKAQSGESVTDIYSGEDVGNYMIYSDENVESKEVSKMSTTAESDAMDFGPGNNIIFGRGSSESGVKDDTVVAIDTNNLDDIKKHVHEMESLNNRAAEPSTEDIPENSLESDEFIPEINAVVKEYSTEPFNTNLPQNSEISSLEHEITTDVESETRRATSYELRENMNTLINARPNAIIEVIKPVKAGDQKHNCNELEREGKYRTRTRPNTERKSYRLSFLFNR